MERHGLEPAEACCTAWTGADGSSDGPADVVEAMCAAAEAPTAAVVLGAALTKALSRSVAGKAPQMDREPSLVVLAGPDCCVGSNGALASYQSPAEELIRWATWLVVQAESGQVPQYIVVPGRMRIGQTAEADTNQQDCGFPRKAIV
jgi:hypothetical protein